MMRYRSGAVNPDWKDNIFTTHFNTQMVTRTVIKPEGSTYASVKTEPFLKLHDPGVHITDVLEDPNGDLLVVDTGGWFRLGCPNSQLAQPHIAGAIYRIRKPGPRDRQSDQWGNKLDWKKASFEDLYSHYNLVLNYAVASILYGLIVLAGYILLIVPGIVWTIKYQFYSYFVVDKGMGPLEAIKASGRATQGHKMHLFGFSWVALGVMILGLIAVFVGLLVAVPVVMLATAYIYRRLSA